MKLLQSFGFAFTGIRIGLGEQNFRIHCVAAVVVLVGGAFFSLTAVEWAVLFLCIGTVLSAELCNSALEKVCDAVLHIDQRAYEKLGMPKDLAAGAVLVISLFSVLVGAMIFWPHILGLILGK